MSDSILLLKSLPTGPMKETAPEMQVSLHRPCGLLNSHFFCVWKDILLIKTSETDSNISGMKYEGFPDRPAQVQDGAWKSLYRSIESSDACHRRLSPMPSSRIPA